MYDFSDKTDSECLAIAQNLAGLITAALEQRTLDSEAKQIKLDTGATILDISPAFSIDFSLPGARQLCEEAIIPSAVELLEEGHMRGMYAEICEAFGEDVYDVAKLGRLPPAEDRLPTAPYIPASVLALIPKAK